MRYIASLILVIGCSGCFGGGGRPTPVSQTEALSIEYSLPVTSVRVSADLVLTSCAPTGMRARPTVALQAVANGSAAAHERFRLYSTELSSWTRNRQIGIELHPNGAIKAVNGGVSDRTGAIVTNVLKTVLSVVPFLEQPELSELSSCNPATAAALRQVGLLEARILALRGELPTAAPNQAEGLRAAIDALAQEIARLRTEHLMISLTKEVEIPLAGIGGLEGEIFWTGRELARWLPANQAGTGPASNFSLRYCLRSATDADAGTCPRAGHANAPPAATPAQANCLPGCPRTIVLREPVNAVMTVVAGSDDFVRLLPGHAPVPIPVNTNLQRTRVPVSQWGSLSYIPLQAGLGESNTFALGLDEFGRRNSFTWKSDARGEGITGAVASIVDAGARLETALRGQELADQQAEISRLQTQQNLNKLRFCREIIEAGGFTCPT